MPTQPPQLDVVRRNVGALREVISELRGSPDAVKIVAVTKTFDASAMDLALRAGCDAVGENYAQELIDKVPQRSELPGLPVHFIGHVQTNKVKSLFPHVALWHTVDRSSLVSAIAREADRFGLPARVLIQVNATEEEQKSGCSPDELEPLLQEARAAGLEVRGLMAMGPSDADPDATRRAFRLVASRAGHLGLGELSMGMTHDVRIAIEEGTTMIRVGSGIFGERPRSA